MVDRNIQTNHKLAWISTSIVVFALILLCCSKFKRNVASFFRDDGIKQISLNAWPFAIVTMAWSTRRWECCPKSWTRNSFALPLAFLYFVKWLHFALSLSFLPLLSLVFLYYFKWTHFASHTLLWIDRVLSPIDVVSLEFGPTYTFWWQIKQKWLSNTFKRLAYLVSLINA